jgi:hypothetical protein
VPTSIVTAAALLVLGLLPGAAHAQASGLAAVREALAASDTVAALRMLDRLTTEESLSADGIGALFLLDWIGRSETYGGAATRAAELRDELWRGIEGGTGNLDSLADSLENRAPSLAAAARWTLVLRLLRSLTDVAAEERRVRVVVLPMCPAGCNHPGVPPPDHRLAARFSTEPSATRLRMVATLLRELEAAPAPFNALGARTHVAVCALLLAAAPADCWPRTDQLVGRDSAEVAAMVSVFQTRYASAHQLMDAQPHWFTHLDASRDLLQVPDSLLDSTVVRSAVPPYNWVSTRLIAVPGSGANIELSVDVFWRLAQPLYLQVYNERLVVHRGRLLMADVVRRLSSGRTPLFGSTGDPARIVRSGVPLAVVPLSGPAARRPDARTTRVYVPRQTHETLPGPIESGSFAPIDLALAVAAPPPYRWMTGFVSETYEFLGMVDHQLVHYVRDGSRYVDVYASWIRPPECARRSGLLLGLIRLDSTAREQHRDVRRDPTEYRREAFNSIVRAGFSRVEAAGTYLYSVEVLDPGCRRAARTRYWIRVPPADDAFLSDLMLTDELFQGTDRAAQRVVGRPGVAMSASSSVRPGGTVRLYWEAYGVTADTAERNRLSVTFEVVDTRRRRVAISDPAAVAEENRQTRGALALTYAQSVPSGAGPLGSGIEVALPAGARGLHVARVTVRDVRTGRAATAERAFYVR